MSLTATSHRFSMFGTQIPFWFLITSHSHVHHAVTFTFLQK